MLDRCHLPLQQPLQVIQVVLDVAAYFIGLIPEAHVLLGELYGLVYIAFVLLDQLFLLLQNQLNVLIMLLTQLLDVLRSQRSALNIALICAVRNITVTVTIMAVMEAASSHKVVKVRPMNNAHISLYSACRIAYSRDDILNSSRLLSLPTQSRLRIRLRRRVLRPRTYSSFMACRYNFGLIIVLVYPVSQCLGVFPLILHVILALGVERPGLRSDAVSGKHEFLL